ncbi:MAG: hypothetical protein FWG44_07315 [Oscillospiraceae bacterium]|nr:hypothetical protein [Oscillospiraceae bacterium]
MNNEEKIISILSGVQSSIVEIQSSIVEIQSEQKSMRSEISEIKSEQKSMRSEISEIKSEQKSMRSEMNLMKEKLDYIAGETEGVHDSIVFLENTLLPKVNAIYEIIDLNKEYVKGNHEPRIIKIEKSVDNLQVDVIALKLKAE